MLIYNTCEFCSSPYIKEDSGRIEIIERDSKEHYIFFDIYRCTNQDCYNKMVLFSITEDDIIYIWDDEHSVIYKLFHQDFCIKIEFFDDVIPEIDENDNVKWKNKKTEWIIKEISEAIERNNIHISIERPLNYKSLNKNQYLSKKIHCSLLDKKTKRNNET